MATFGYIDKIANLTGGAGISTKSYDFTSRGLGAGTYFVAGYYDGPSTDANLNQGSPTQVLGSINQPYAAHASLVAGGPGAAAGGVGAVEIEVSGTSINDNGLRTPGDSQVIVSDITALVLNEYAETPKKWIGQVIYTLQNAPGSTQTTFNADFNYLWTKYDDLNNSDFIIRGIECVGLSGATDTDFNIRLLKHDVNGWVYSPASFSPGGTEITNMQTVHSVENSLNSNEPFAFKVANLSESVNGSLDEGFIIEISVNNNNSIQIMDAHILVEVI